MVTSRHVTKDDGHTIRSVVSETLSTRKLHNSVLQKQSYCRSKFYIARIGIFDLFCSVTLTLTRWPSCTNLTRIPSRYDKGDRRRYSKKLSKRRSSFDVRKYVFWNMIVDKRHSLSECCSCITRMTLNSFSHVFKVDWNRRASKK